MKTLTPLQSDAAQQLPHDSAPEADASKGLSTPKILQGALNLLRKHRVVEQFERRIDHLDIGAGNGELIWYFSRHFKARSSACDYTADLMQLAGQSVDICDLNQQPLPYAGASFDVVTLTEVIEHVENHRFVLREIFRVLRPGGYVVITTPNILNIKSRLRFVGFGFWNLFGPMHFRESKLYSTGGHINPIGYFYIAHSLVDAGFEVIDHGIDRVQRSGLLVFALLYPLIRLYSLFAIRKERKRYGTIDEHNLPFVETMNRRALLLGRTVIVLAHKPQERADSLDE